MKPLVDFINEPAEHAAGAEHVIGNKRGRRYLNRGEGRRLCSTLCSRGVPGGHFSTSDSVRTASRATPLLRWSPSHTARRLLKPFGIDDSLQLGELKATCPGDRGYTQPDLCLESDTTRVFIEVKVGSQTDMPQVQKYLRLHADEDNEHGARKAPYLFFLTRDEFVNHWSPRSPVAGNVNKFLRAATEDAALGKVAKGAGPQVLARYEEVKRTIQYGAATWRSIGEILVNTCEEHELAGGHETDIRIMADFIAELRQRGLMPTRA